MNDAYKIADLVVLPSKSESFGYSALESLSLCIPTILNNIPTFNEIAEGSNGSYFFDGSDVSLSLILSHLLDQPMVKARNLQSKSWMDRYDLREWSISYQKVLEK
jgi:glycosyltransferase involved in cell wall biosynthesis